MLKKIILLSVTLFLASVFYTEAQDKVTMQTLLEEMVDRESLTRFPSYTQKQMSSYDRRSVSPDKPGWFANVDGRDYIRLEKNEGRWEKVMFDEKGPGVVTRFWITTKNKKGAIRIYLDGAKSPQIVYSSYDLMKFPLEIPDPLLVAHKGYKEELEAVGGNNFFLPIPYGKSCKITYESQADDEKYSRYYQVNFRTYPEGTQVETFTLENARNAMDKINEVSKTLLNPENFTDGSKETASADVPAGESISLTLPKGKKAVRNLMIRVSGVDSEEYEQAMAALQVNGKFDGKLCIDAPYAYFAGAGAGLPEVHGWYLDSDGQGMTVCRFVMPYQKGGEISIINGFTKSVKVEIEATVSPYKWDKSSLYFHTSFRKEDGVILSTKINDVTNVDWNYVTVKGGRGVFVGDLLSLFNHTHKWYGEGDEKIWVDDESFPSHFGTGTEDYYNTSWCSAKVFHSPFGGLPRGGGKGSHGYNSCLRTRNLDAIPFTTSFQFDMEMRGHQPGTADVTATTFWYGDRSAKAVSK